MQQRQLRLGDLLDDYVLATASDESRHRRRWWETTADALPTCDTEHEHKHAKVPASAQE
jgi:hypothetical protein